jgi:hypothetical protein
MPAIATIPAIAIIDLQFTITLATVWWWLHPCPWPLSDELNGLGLKYEAEGFKAVAARGLK